MLALPDAASASLFYLPVNRQCEVDAKPLTGGAEEVDLASQYLYAFSNRRQIQSYCILRAKLLVDIEPHTIVLDGDHSFSLF